MPQAVPTVTYTALSSGHYQSRDFFLISGSISHLFHALKHDCHLSWHNLLKYYIFSTTPKLIDSSNLYFILKISEAFFY